MFKVNNKGAKRLTYFAPFSNGSIVNFEQVNVCWVIRFIQQLKSFDENERGKKKNDCR